MKNIKFVADVAKVTLMLVLVYSWLLSGLFLLQWIQESLFWFESKIDRYVRFNESWRRLFGRNRK